MKDFVSAGDLFIVEGKRYHVRSIDSPRSVILANGSEYRFTIGGVPVVWDEEARGWATNGGRLESVGGEQG